MAGLSNGGPCHRRFKKNDDDNAADIVAVEEFMEHLIAAEKGESLRDRLDEPPPLKCEVNYAIRTWLDHRRHGTYPRAGGYDDQDPDLMDDWHTLTLYHIRVENGVVVHVRMPTDGPDVSEQMGD